MTNSPQSIAEALARKCARNLLLRNGLGSDEKDVELILQSIPLVELLECVQELRIRDEIARCNRKSDCKELSKLNEKLRELKVIE